MLKKRLIFTLLYDQGNFMLSRNFRLQKVGNMKWLHENYNFSKIAFAIDELVVLNVSKRERNLRLFCEHLKELTKNCFIPIAAGGGIRSLADVHELVRSGADKVVLNTSLSRDPNMIHEISNHYGRQCVIGAVDVKKSREDEYKIWIENGSICIDESFCGWMEKLQDSGIGEIYLNSMDKDGTGQGYEMKLLDLLPKRMSVPVIMAGGVGNSQHLAEGLLDKRLDAVATANLFNFVGNGLSEARSQLLRDGFALPVWN